MTRATCHDCDRPADTDRPVGVSADGKLVTEPVCWAHASSIEKDLAQAVKERGRAIAQEIADRMWGGQPPEGEIGEWTVD